MNFMKPNQDELLNGFCRGCLKKYDDPAELLHYTEKNRRLFVYSTGIQVKRDDIFTFQLCKQCYISMRISCNFKKQCRSSDRRFKSFLRLQEVGDGPDLVTFLAHSENDMKFPLSGNSTPLHTKKDEDNESICTSIRNFMTDILQGEDMPDTEARIIKEVIEEEADLEDSLDSHWLQDDASVDNDFRLDFSFSPFTTPRSVNNDHCYTPIKQIEPSLHCKNNHTKKVLLQLPTSQCSHHDSLDADEPKSFTNDTSLAKRPCQNEDEVLHGKITTNTVNLPGLIDQSEGLIIRNETDITVNIETDDMDRSSVFELESQVGKNKFPMSESDVAVKNLYANSFGVNTEDNAKKIPLADSKTTVQSDLNDFDGETRLGKDRFSLIETNKAVESITLGCGLGFFRANSEYGDSGDEIPDSENNPAVKIVNLRNPSPEVGANHQNKLNDTENNNGNGNFDYTVDENEDVESSPEVSSKTIEKSNTKEMPAIEASITVLPSEVFAVKTEPTAIGNNNFTIVSDIFAHKTDIEVIKKEYNPLGIDNDVLDQKEDINHEEGLQNQSNNLMPLDDLLRSPIGDRARISTPTINKILFAENLDDDSAFDVDGIEVKVENVYDDDEVDVLEEFFKEGVKDFDQRAITLQEDLPLHLKYDFKKLHCLMCNKKFGSQKGLKIHLMRIHFVRFPRERKERGKGICKKCGKVFENGSNLARHVRTHNKNLNETFKCDLCNLTISNIHSYKKHVKAHKSITKMEEQKPSEERKHLCPACGLAFKKPGQLVAHKRTHTTAYTHVCEICNKGFYRAWDFEIHNRRVHTKERPYSCTKCGRSFAVMYNLVRHMRKHDVVLLQCAHCDAKFREKTKLISHLTKSRSCRCKWGNPVKRIYKCPACPIKYARKDVLNRHIRTSPCGAMLNSSTPAIPVVYETKIVRTAESVIEIFKIAHD